MGFQWTQIDDSKASLLFESIETAIKNSQLSFLHERILMEIDITENKDLKFLKTYIDLFVKELQNDVFYFKNFEKTSNYLASHSNESYNETNIFLEDGNKRINLTKIVNHDLKIVEEFLKKIGFIKKTIDYSIKQKSSLFSIDGDEDQEDWHPKI